ncbi:MAG: SAM-dependent methyltransferase, partial [Planctomycetota bacterium]
MKLGHRVVAVDRDISKLGQLAGHAGVEAVQADLESGKRWPLEGRSFAGIVVTDYLWRPLFPRILESLEPRGVLIYETFAEGQERLGRPRRPEFLLKPGELLHVFAGALVVMAYEHGQVAEPEP